MMNPVRSAPPLLRRLSAGTRLRKEAVPHRILHVYWTPAQHALMV